MLESFDIGSRLGRGRSYARRGQVLSIDIDKGLVKAKVQGSSPTPYKVTIKLNMLSTADWQKLATCCRSRRSLRPSCLLAKCRKRSNRLHGCRTIALPHTIERSGDRVLLPRLVKSRANTSRRYTTC